MISEGLINEEYGTYDSPPQCLAAEGKIDVPMGGGTDTVYVQGVGGERRVMGECTVEFCVNGMRMVLRNVMIVPGLNATILSVSQAVKEGYEFVFNTSGVYVGVAGAGKRHKIGTIDNKLFRSVARVVTNSVPAVKVEEYYGDTRDTSVVNSEFILACEVVAEKENELLHKRLGHPSHPVLARMAREQAAQGIPAKYAIPEHKCGTCMRPKKARPAFDDNFESATGLLELVHADVMGPFQVPSLGGSKYALVIVDDYSRYSVVECVASKADVPEELLATLVRWQNQCGVTVRTLRTDQGTEFCNKIIDGYCKRKGIQHQLSAVYTPQQNGRVERINRTIMDKARALLIDSGLPHRLWAEAVKTAVRLYNVTLPVRKPLTPFEVFHGRKPDLTALRVFGCKAYMQKPAHKRKKLDDKAYVGSLVGYSQHSKAYRVLYRSETGALAIAESRNVDFDEKSRGPFVSKSRPCADVDVIGDTGECFGIASESDPDHHQTQAQEQAIFPAMNDETVMNAPANEHSLSGYAADSDGESTVAHSGASVYQEASSQDDLAANEEHEEHEEPQEDVPDLPAGPADVHVDVPVPQPEPMGSTTAADGVRRSVRVQRNAMYMADYSDELTDEPTSLAECQKRPDWPKWEEAVNKEVQALIELGSFTVVEREVDMNPIPTKWVFKIKRDEKGRVDKYKARLVAKGFKQLAGKDYDEVYAPVGKHATFRMLLTEAVNEDLEMIHLDVRSAFLNAKLQETVHLIPPHGFATKGKVWLLHKAVNGLKQSGRAWHLHLKQVLQEMKLTITHSDESLYIFKSVEDGRLTFVLVYVDDLMLVGPTHTVKKLKEILEKLLEIEDRGDAVHFLGMEIIRDRAEGTIWVGQSQNALGVLKKYGMQDAKARKTPLDANLPLMKLEGEADDQVKDTYQSMVGSLLYLANCTRPDLAQSVGLLARFMSNPSEDHLAAAKQVLRYLAGTVDYGLKYTKSESQLIGYCDADYAGDLDKRKSTSGFVFLRSGGAVSWSSKLQSTVALSTCEAEFISSANAIREALWLRNLLGDFRGQVECVKIHGDNQGALKLLHHPHAHQRTKHIDVAHRFAQDRVEMGEVKFEYIRTDLMVADCTTKVVPLKKFEENRGDMGMVRRSEK